MYTVSITSQGQITLPAKVRRELGFKKNSKAILSIENGKAIIEVVPDFFSLKGLLKGVKPAIPEKQLDEAFAGYMAQQALGISDES